MAYEKFKQIKFNLSSSSIKNAIKELKDYTDKTLKETALELLEVLGQKGAEQIRTNLSNIAYYETQEVSATIYYKIESSGDKNTLRIGVNHPQAKFIEFGTGIVGASEAHPEANEFGWIYDINSHGESGWWYPLNENFVGQIDPDTLRYSESKNQWYAWTQGMPSGRFMYDTANWIKEQGIKEAIVIVRGK